MNLTNTRQSMADAKFYEAYSRYDEELGRYETWNEAVERVMNMHRGFYKDKMTDELSEMIDYVEKHYKSKNILGAQRALQFGGDQLLKNQARLYNCTASYCDRPEFFGESFHLMLCGAGVGFSVQKQHIAKLPDVQNRKKQAKTFVVPDTIEGWAESLDVLMSSFFVGGGKHPEYEGNKIYFDLSKIRPKGAYISGGFKAPGPEGLRVALDKIERKIKEALNEGRTTLKPIEAYDIIMYVADAVISGGVRRSATICIFSKDDEEMLNAKTGSWYIDNPQRGRSNNSVALLRNETTKEEFDKIMESVKQYGEPGFIWMDDLEILFNPCCEISMMGYTEDGKSGFQFCNLTEINGANSNTLEEFLEQAKVASILGTLQAGYTDFKFVTEETKKIVEKEALIGVSITGWMNNPDILFDESNMKSGAEEVKKWNKKVAKIIGINPAARTTTVKPSGNASTILGTASGIHGEHSPLYIRHVQLNKETEVAKMFMKENPKMCESSVWTKTDVVVGFPVVSPEGSMYKSSLLGKKQLDYVKKAQNGWVEHGTNVELCVKPYLRHNVSNTITVDDWDEVRDYIYDNRYYLAGVSLMSALGDKAYPQAPFTEIFTEEQILEKYGQVAMFASGLIERGLNAFNNDLWNACSTALGYGEKLTNSHKDSDKQEFIRSFEKFSKNFITDLTEQDKNEYDRLVEEKTKLMEEKDSLEEEIFSILNTVDIIEESLDSERIINDLILQVDEKQASIYELSNFIHRIENQIKESKMHKAIEDSSNVCANCLKDVYNLHKWWKIQDSYHEFEWASELEKKEYTDIGTLGAQACAGGACEVW